MPYTNSHESSEPTRSVVDTWAGPALIEFGTPWCGHCIAAQPLIEAALSDFPEVHHVKIEDGPGRPLGRSFRVKLWPTLVFIRAGSEVARLVRPTDAQSIRDALQALAAPKSSTTPDVADDD